MSAARIEYTSNKYVDVYKLLYQLQNSKVIIQRLPLNFNVISDYKLNNVNWSSRSEEYFLNDPGKKYASNISKPFCPNCKESVEFIKNKKKRCSKCASVLQYKCMHCNKLYKNYAWIKIHQCITKTSTKSSKSDDNTKIHQCTKCQKNFHYTKNFKKHIRVCAQKYLKNSQQNNGKQIIIHKKAKYIEISKNKKKQLKNISVEVLSNTKCPKCKSVLKNSMLLKRHLLYRHQPPRFFCDLCCFKTSFLHSLKYHLINHLKNGDTTCNLPKGQSSLIRAGCKHCSKKIHKSSSIICKTCKKLLFYECTTCSKKFISFLTTKYHISKSHSSLLKMKKDIKNRGCFKESSNEKKNKIKKKKCSKIPDKCDYCDYTNRFKAGLKKHMDTCVLAKNGNKTIFESNVQENIPEILPEINSSYEIITNYEKDSVKKENFVEQFCQKCNVKFKHINFECLKCIKCNINLTFECKKCSKQFNQPQKVQAHLRFKCVPEKIYSCKKCVYQCTVKSIFDMHLKRKHN